jgi:hypothetical protein
MVADRSLPPGSRLDAAQGLVSYGEAGAPILAALGDLKADPAHAATLRKLEQFASYAGQALRWLDFAGKQPQAGRWDTLDGSVPGSTTQASGALLWASPGATRTVIAFPHLGGGFGPLRGWLSIALLHRTLRPLAANVVYIRDESLRLHFCGIHGLGSDYSASIQALGQALRSRGWGPLHTFGESSGGYTALRFGLDLGARAVLSMSGPTSMAGDTERNDPRLVRFYRDAPQFAVDLLPLYRASAKRPRLLLCYGEDNAYDTRMAQRMAELPGTELVPFAGFAGHSTFIEAMRTRTLAPLATRLLE